jgi:hypothetical protein
MIGHFSRFTPDDDPTGSKHVAVFYYFNCDIDVVSIDGNKIRLNIIVFASISVYDKSIKSKRDNNNI